LPISTAHDQALVAEFPETAGFAPQRYALSQLLTADRKGRFKTRINQRIIKLLCAVKPALDRLLEEGEQVMRVAGGTAYYPMEIFLGNGWLTTLYNRYILVATDRRLLAINTDHKMRRPAHYFFQYPYNELKKITRGLFGTSLSLIRKRGKRRTFTGVNSALTRQMNAYLTEKIETLPPSSMGAQPQEYLCPGCFTPLEAGLDACPHCRVQFKNPRRAALRSLLLPGLGDIYLGHRFLGGLELLGSILMWGFLFSLMLSEDQSQLGFVAFLMLIYCGMDALLTLHMGKKGYSPEKNQPSGVAAGPAASGARL
jgi:hypothetical protein